MIGAELDSGYQQEEGVLRHVTNTGVNMYNNMTLQLNRPLIAAGRVSPVPERERYPILP
jgi:hypothetical protein